MSAVNTRMVQVFATNFKPDVEADELAQYLENKLSRKVGCVKLGSNPRQASFHVKVECEKVEEVYGPELWPKGIFVRRFRPTQRGYGGGGSQNSESSHIMHEACDWGKVNTMLLAG